MPGGSLQAQRRDTGCLARPQGFRDDHGTRNVCAVENVGGDAISAASRQSGRNPAVCRGGCEFPRDDKSFPYPAPPSRRDGNRQREAQEPDEPILERGVPDWRGRPDHLTGAGLAQELEPGAYWPIPKGVNIVTAIGGINWGDVAFEPSLPVEDASATIGTSALAFTRAFGLGGRSANAMVMLPLVGGHLTGRYFGEHTVVDRSGSPTPSSRSR